VDSRRSSLDHLGLLPELTGLFGAALRTADLTARAPALNGWTVADVGAHVIGVHRWVTVIVREGTRPARQNRPDDVVDVVAAYPPAADELLRVLREADPDASAWSLDRADRRVGFWARRQLHEVLVHLWDVRSAADPTPAAIGDVAPAVCADGVDELLQMMATRLGRDPEPLPGPLALHATDTGDRWLLLPDWTLAEQPSDPVGQPTATVEASARALLLHVWGRGRLAEVSGDEATLRAFDRAPCR
jgi:uncharacterized protein (TIGR03083 family)